MNKLSINRDTKLCMSLSGRPTNFGTRFQNHLYEECGLDYVYKAFTTQNLAGAVVGVRALGIRGCAVSMPFKEQCISLIDELHPSAAAIGSVNTIVNDDGYLRGYNTDYTAITGLIEQYEICKDVAFVLRGSGGMAKAVASALRDEGFTTGTIVARNERSGRALAAACGCHWRPDVAGTPAMLINVTPIGMAGGAEADDLAFSPEAIAGARIVFDVVALPSETPLIREARSRGKTVITGAEVTVRQSVEQFSLYTGVVPSPEQLRRAAEFALS